MACLLQLDSLSLLPLPDTVFLLVVSTFLGLLSGWLGVGGGLLLIPVLLYILPVFFGVSFHLLGLSWAYITGLSALQNLAGSSSSMVLHAQQGRQNKALVWALAPMAVVGSFAGAYASKWLPDSFLSALLIACLSLTWVTCFYKLVWLPVQEKLNNTSPPPEADFLLSPAARWFLPVLSGLLSFLAGALGVGGAIFLLPLLMYALKVPVRVAIGSTSFVVWLIALASVLGKAQQGLLPAGSSANWELITLVVLGAVLGGIVGGFTHNKIPTLALRWLHYALVSLSLTLSIWQPKG